MLVDYMVRHGFSESAKALAKERGIEELCDIEVFESSRRIAERLKQGSITECLQWCNENKTTLKKMNVRPYPLIPFFYPHTLGGANWFPGTE